MGMMGKTINTPQTQDKFHSSFKM